jgi:predicted KAP-like P-loop ATPase
MPFKATTKQNFFFVSKSKAIERETKKTKNFKLTENDGDEKNTIESFLAVNYIQHSSYCRARIFFVVFNNLSIHLLIFQAEHVSISNESLQRKREISERVCGFKFRNLANRIAAAFTRLM